ncbi:Molybdenum transport system permease protein ModB [Proteus vulgaris]|nr:Molybdenum transport system permease protein ModB [Proteus vulgaris]
MLSEYEWQAIILSLKVSTVAVIISLPFGIFMAWLLVRVRFPGKSLLDSIIHLPLVLPPVVVGYLWEDVDLLVNGCMTGLVLALHLVGEAQHLHLQSLHFH